MKKEDKVSIKIDREVYKKLQQIKLDQDYRSVSDIIKSLLKSI